MSKAQVPCHAPGVKTMVGRMSRGAGAARAVEARSARAEYCILKNRENRRAEKVEVGNDWILRNDWCF